MTTTARPPTLVDRWPWLWFFAGALIYLSFGYTEMMGSDLWWHIAAGREIVQTGTLWLVDDWSYTALGNAWHNHEWLADLVFYGWVSLFGMESLVIWKWLLIVGTFTLLQSVLQRVGQSPIAPVCAAAFAAAIAAPFMDMRPQLYTLFGVALLLHLTLMREARLRELLPLFLCWANLHGGFVFGLMLLTITVFPWRDLSWIAFRRAAGLVLACAAISLLNPDGAAVFWLPLVYALDASSPYRGLGEWRSPFEAGGIASSLYLYSLVVGVVAFFWLLPSIRRRIPLLPEAIAMAALTGAMSVTSRRFIILYAIGIALLLTPFLAALLRQRALAVVQVPLLLALFAFGVYRLQPYPLRTDVAFHYLTADYAYPHDLMAYVEQNGLTGNVFAYYNWGGFLHLRTDGALKVFIDGRANTVFDDQAYADYVGVLGDRPGWVARMEHSGAQLFLWPSDRRGLGLVRKLMSSGRWQLLYQDPRGSLLAHQDLPLPRTLRLPKETPAAELTSAAAALRRGDNASALETVVNVREERPWDHTACRLGKRSLQGLGRADDAQALIAECRSWFPSRYLR